MLTSFTILVGVLGYLSGYMTQWGVAKIHGHRVILPFVSSTSRNFTIMALVLAGLSLYSIVRIEQSNARDEQQARATAACFQRFAGAISYNTDLTASTRDLDSRADTLRDESRMAIQRVVSDLTRSITALPAPSPDELAAVLGPFNAQAVQIDSDLAAIDSERATKNSQRVPYPEPTCVE